MNKIIWGLIGIMLMLISFGIGIYAGNNAGKIETTATLQPQIDTIIQENASLKKEIQLKDELIEKNENTKIELQNKTNELNTITKKIKKISQITLDCFWATIYSENYQFALNHFDGKDYKEEYIIDCIQNANKNWETIIEYNE